MTVEEKLKKTQEALAECIDVLQSKEMLEIWTFLYAHNYKWTGKILPLENMKQLLAD